MSNGRSAGREARSVRSPCGLLPRRCRRAATCGPSGGSAIAAASTPAAATVATTPLGSSSITGCLSGSAIGRLCRRHVLGSGTATLRRGTATVTRVPRAAALLSALRLSGTSAGTLLGAHAASLALPTLGTCRSGSTAGNAVVPATTRGLGRIGIGLHVVCHRDLELLGSKLDASRTALAVATPRGLMLTLTCFVFGRSGCLALLGTRSRAVPSVTRAPATTLGLHEEVRIIKALGRGHTVRTVKLGEGHAHIGRL